MKIKILLILSLLLVAASQVLPQNPNANAAKVGDLAPDFVLKAHNDKTITLSETVKTAPVVLVFYRGHWCPFCVRQLADLRGLLGANDKAQLFAVSIDPTEQSRLLVNKIEKDGKGKINYLLLSDPKAETVDAYNLRDERYKNEDTNGIPLPAVYLINRERKIVWASIDKDYKKRPENQAIRREIERAVNQ